MVQSTKITARGWLFMGVGIALVGAGLYLLGQTLFLDQYDATGMQVNCGNGYENQLLQATVDDENSGLSGSATNYVDQCVHAILRQRAWAAPLAGLGTLLIVAEVALWVRRGAPWAGINGPDENGRWSAEDHPAAELDGREREHRSGPSTTTPSTL